MQGKKMLAILLSLVLLTALFPLAAWSQEKKDLPLEETELAEITELAGEELLEEPEAGAETDLEENTASKQEVVLTDTSEEGLIERFGLEEETESYDGYLVRFDEGFLPENDLENQAELEAILPEDNLYRVEQLSDLAEVASGVTFVEPDYRLELLETDLEILPQSTENNEELEALEPISQDELPGALADSSEITSYEAEDNLPNDQFYIDGKQWNLSMVGFETAWQQNLTGKGIVVGVIDTGINASHEDFANTKILEGYNFVNDTTEVKDINGHGTSVASLIAASTNNECGLASIASGVSIVPLRIFDDKGNANVSTLIKAIAASGSYGCQIVNMSVGLDEKYYSQELSNIIAKTTKSGLILVAAVGNKGTSDLKYPAACEGVIGVGSVNSKQVVSSFSQHNASVDLVAPGEEVYRALYSNNTGYQKGNGTSFATPLVSAAAAILLEAKPGLNSEEVLEILSSTATDLGEEGWDPYYGYGLISISKFLNGDLFKITVDGEITNGTLTASSTEAARGTKITLTAVPNTGYQLVYGSVTVNGQPVVTEDLSFKMLSENVTVSALFEPLNQAPKLIGGYYQISSASELGWFRNQVNLGSSGIKAVLTQDIELNPGSFDEKGNWSETGNPAWWFPIGAYQKEQANSLFFSGDFNGQGHTISGLYAKTTGNYKGLFGLVSSGTIENLTLQNVYLASGSYGGGIAGMTKNVDLNNCHFSGTIYGNQHVGGLVGYAEKTKISSCESEGKLDSYYIYTDSYSNCGGIVGCFAYGTMQDCRFSGSVSGVYAAGGIIGYLYCSEVADCYNEGSISGTNCVGGISGRTYGSDITSILLNCYNYGQVSGSYAGGISGYHKQATVKSCFNLGDVDGEKYLGGLVGFNYAGKIANSWCRSQVTGTGSIIGGLVGANSGSVLNCYYAGDVSGSTYVSPASGAKINPAPIVGSNYTGYKVSSGFWWYQGKQIVNGVELADSAKQGMGNANKGSATSGLFSFQWNDNYWKLSGGFVIYGESNDHMLMALNAWAASNAASDYSYWTQDEDFLDNYPYLINTYQNPDWQGVFEGVSLTLQSELALNFQVDQAWFKDLVQAGIRFNDQEDLAQGLAQEQGSNYSFDYLGIAAKKMANPIRAVLFAQNEDGSKQFGQVLSYKLADYMTKVLGSPDYGTELKTLLVDLANYGTAAQTHFKYNTANPLNSAVKEYQSLSSGTIKFTDADYKYSVTSTGKPIKDFDLALKLESRTEVWLQVNSGGYSAKDLILQVEYCDLEGNLQTWQVDGAKQDFINSGVIFNKLSAEQMDDVFRISVKNRAGETVSETVTYSIASYAVYVDRNSSDAELKDLTNKLVQTGRSAARYFNYTTNNSLL